MIALALPYVHIRSFVSLLDRVMKVYDLRFFERETGGDADGVGRRSIARSLPERDRQRIATLVQRSIISVSQRRTTLIF